MRPNPFLDLGERILAKEALEAYAKVILANDVGHRVPDFGRIVISGPFPRIGTRTGSSVEISACHCRARLARSERFFALGDTHKDGRHLMTGVMT